MAIVFPSKSLSKNPRTGEIGRQHVSPSGLQKPFKEALRKSRVPKNPSPHTLRHSFATHLLQDVCGYSHDSGFVRTQGNFDDDDIHARFAKLTAQREKSD